MKTCSACRAKKPRDAFNKNRRRKDGLQSRCRECVQQRARETYQRSPTRRAQVAERREALRERNRSFLLGYLREHPCVDCGEADPIVLEFDHVRGEKVACVSVMLDAALERLTAEIAKCEVRCGNCHRLKTAREQGHWMHEVTRHLFDRD